MGLLTNIRLFKQKWQGIDLVEEVAIAASFHQDELAELNRQQLIDGIGADGRHLPKYEDDPYWQQFPNPKERALAYQRWKSGISPSRTKPADVMDLFINGYTHSKVFAKVSPYGIRHGIDTSWGQRLDNITYRQATGLTKENKAAAFNQLLRKRMVLSIARQTGAKVK